MRKAVLFPRGSEKFSEAGLFLKKTFLIVAHSLIAFFLKKLLNAEAKQIINFRFDFSQRFRGVNNHKPRSKLLRDYLVAFVDFLMERQSLDIQTVSVIASFFI